MGFEGSSGYEPPKEETKEGKVLPFKKPMEVATHSEREEEKDVVLSFDRDSRLSKGELSEIQNNLQERREVLERVYKEEGPFDYSRGVDEAPILKIGEELEEIRNIHGEMGHKMVRTDEEKDGTKIRRDDFYEGDSKIPINTTVRTINGENPDGIDRTYEYGGKKKMVFKTPEDSDRWKAKQKEKQRAEEEERKRRLENGEDLGRLPSRFEI